MPFRETVGNGIMAVLDYAKAANEKYQANVMKYKDKYRYYDDDRLYQAFLRTSGVEKAVCADILKKRRNGEDAAEYYGEYEDEELGGY